MDKKRKDILISIIIPAYNAADKIDKLIESLIKQNYKYLEIIIVDNNSTDNTLNILESYAKKYKQIKVLTEKKQGPNYARKKGFDASKGDYVYFVDADDFIENDTINGFIDCIKKTNADIVIGDYLELDQDYKIIKRMSCGPNTDKNLKSKKDILLYKPSLWIKFIKRDLITPESFVFTNIAEDINISILALAKAKNIRHINKTVYNYVVGINGLSNKICFKKIVESKKALEILKTNFINNNLYEDYKEEIDYIILTHSLYRAFEGSMLDNKNELCEIREQTISTLKTFDYKNNKYYKNSKVYRLVNFYVNSNLLYSSSLSKIFIKLLFKNKLLNRLLKKLDK